MCKRTREHMYTYCLLTHLVDLVRTAHYTLQHLLLAPSCDQGKKRPAPHDGRDRNDGTMLMLQLMLKWRQHLLLEWKLKAI